MTLRRPLVSALAGLAALVAAASSFAFLAGRGPGPGGITGAVWVANEGAGTLPVLDAGSNEVVATLTGVAAPHNVQAGNGLALWVASGRGTVQVQLYATPDGRRLVVANQGTPARPGRTVSVVATSPLREIGKIPAGAGPHGVVVDPSGRRAYVTNTYGGTVSVLDLVRRLELAEIPTGRAPNGITFSPPAPVRAHRPVALGAGRGGHRH